MRQVYDRITEPVAIFTLEEIKEYAKITYDDEDSKIQDITTEIVEWAEDFTWRALNVSNWELRCEGWYYRRAGKDTDSIIFRRNPVKEILSVQYYDTDNVLQTLDTSVYYLSRGSWCELRYNSALPSVYDRQDSVLITFTAGDLRIPKGIMIRIKELIAYQVMNLDDRFIEGRMRSIAERRLAMYRLKQFI